MAKSTAAPVKYLRVTTANAETRVDSAGAFWAGISEVPLASLSEHQVKTLKADNRLTVEETECKAEAEAEAG
mgnify:CR=1 FL=1